MEFVKGQHRKNDECLLMGNEYKDQLCPELIDETIYKINGYNFERTIRFNKGYVQQIHLHASRIKKDELDDSHENFSELIEDFFSSFKSANSKYSKDLVKFTNENRDRGKFFGRDCNFHETITHRYRYENSYYTMYIVSMYDCNDDDIEHPNIVAKVGIQVYMTLSSINKFIEEIKTVDSEL